MQLVKTKNPICPTCHIEMNSHGDDTLPKEFENYICLHCPGNSRLVAGTLSVIQSVLCGIKGIAFTKNKRKWFRKIQNYITPQVSLGGVLASVSRDWWKGKAGDRYQEVVTRLDTNVVIRHTDEPLSNHTEHGSARPDKNQNDHLTPPPT